MKISGKKVFVTGGDGFIGSHLVEELVKRGAEVTSLVFYNSWNSIGWLSDVDKDVVKNIKIVFGDIRDSNLMERLTCDFDIIFHLAALISIPYSYEAPESFIETNVKGTLNVLNAALKNDIEKVLHTSTSEVYGTAVYVPIDEKHPLQPQSPYSASKIAADMLALSYYNTYELPVTIVRPFNTYGPRQTPRAIIPSIILQCLKNKDAKKPVKIGSLSPKRDFNFVKDVVGAFIKIAETKKTAGMTLNIASEHDISIKELAEKIMKIMGINLPFEKETERIRPDKSEVMQLLGDASNLKKLCGWQSNYDIQKGLEATIDWAKKRGLEIDSDRYWF